MFEDLFEKDIDGGNNRVFEEEMAQLREEEVWDTGSVWSTGQVPKGIWTSNVN